MSSEYTERGVLSRLAEGDSICFSQDGDYAWFTGGDRSEVPYKIMVYFHDKGYLSRICLNDENYRGMSERDVISDKGRERLAWLDGAEPQWRKDMEDEDANTIDG